MSLLLQFDAVHCSPVWHAPREARRPCAGSVSPLDPSTLRSENDWLFGPDARVDDADDLVLAGALVQAALGDAAELVPEPPLASRPRKCGVVDVWIVWISTGERRQARSSGMQPAAWPSVSFAAKPLRL